MCGREGRKMEIIIIIKLLFLDYGCAKSQISLSLPPVKKMMTDQSHVLQRIMLVLKARECSC